MYVLTVPQFSFLKEQPNNQGGRDIRMAVTLDILECGFAEQMERATLTNGELKHIRFPSLVGLIRHPTAGVMLFDTGE